MFGKSFGLMTISVSGMAVICESLEVRRDILFQREFAALAGGAAGSRRPGCRFFDTLAWMQLLRRGR